MRDKIVVTVKPSAPEERLEIADAFQQVLDFLKLIESAAGPGTDFDWRLEKASTNSPFTVVAQTPTEFGRDRAVTIPAAQTRAQEGLRELSKGTVPNWMRKQQRSTARRITRRMADGIGKVELKTGETVKRGFNLTPIMARKALRTLERVDGIEDIFIPRHRSYGEIEGVLLSVGAHYGKPAAWVQSTAYNVVVCLFEKEKIAALGDEATIREVWEHKRVKLIGELLYAEGGSLERIKVDTMELFGDRFATLEDVFDDDITLGMEPVEYLDKLHNGEIN